MRQSRIQVVLAAWAALLLLEGVAVPKNPQKSAAGGEFVCGTAPALARLALARGRYLEDLNRGRGRVTQRAAAELQAVQADIGNIAVLQDDGTIITSTNVFDLEGRSFRFEPGAASAYSVVSSTTPFNGSGGTSVRLLDDDTAEVALGFQFTFYGRTWDRVRLNSDGNLTFGEGDVAESSRDLGRFVSGPPRIGPFFADLNPEQGTVSYRSDEDGILFAWTSVPDFDSQFSANSFSVKLFRSGSIEFAYGSRVDTGTAVVGISPGGDGDIRAIDFRAGLPTSEMTGSIVEVFALQPEISESALAKKFFKTHPDEFDQLVVFLAFPFSISGAFAYELNTKNEIEGIGHPVEDYSANYGSSGRLRSFVLMGSLHNGDGTARFPENPTLNFFRTYNSLQVLAHEVAHRWLAYPDIEVAGYSAKSLIHRSDQAHWSFFFNADASVMEGNQIEDRGADRGSDRFRTVAATNKYGSLDQYLMGYASREEVPPMFVVVDTFGTTRGTDSLPSASETLFGGTRKDFTVDSVIAANGVRTPSAYQSPKVIRQAFILLTRIGQEATTEQVAKLQRIHDAWVPFFNQLTGGRGYAATNLKQTPGTTATRLHFPYFQGDQDRYTGIAVANWGSAPADVLFRAYDAAGSLLATPQGIINPRMLTIAPGAQLAMLAEQIHGLSLADPRNGWIEAESTSSEIAGFYLDGDVDLTYLDGAVAGSATARELYFTRVQAGSSTFAAAEFRNQLSIVNPGTTAANLTLTFFDELGAVRGTATRALNPRGRLAEEIRALFPGIGPNPTRGYVHVTSDSGVVGYQGIDNGSTVYALPAQPASAATRLFSAQFASGNASGLRYFSDLNLVNTGTGTRTVQLLLVGNDGNPVSGIPNPITKTLARGEQLRSRADVIFGLPDPALASQLVEGSLTITADGPGVIGDVTFGDPVSQRFLAALPLDAAPVSSLVLSQVAQGSPNQGKPYFTGVAILNPNSTDVSVTVEVFSESGIKTGTGTLQIARGGRVSRTLPELVPAVQQQVRGYIRIVSTGGPVIAFELFGDQSLEFLAAVPSQPAQ